MNYLPLSPLPALILAFTHWRYLGNACWEGNGSFYLFFVKVRGHIILICTTKIFTKKGKHTDCLFKEVHKVR